MKNKKYSLFSSILISLLSASFLSGCNFSNNSNVKDNSSINENSELEIAKQNGITELRNYPDYKNYRRAEISQIEQIIAQGVNAINNVSNKDAIPYLIKLYKEQIDAIKTKDQFEVWEQDSFVDFREECKQELENYLNLSEYTTSKQVEIRTALNNANNELNLAKSFDELLNIVDKYKKILTNIVNDDPEREMTLDDCKSTQQIDSYKNKGYTNLYKDCNFKDGFIVTKPSHEVGISPYHSDLLRLYPSTNQPTWTIAQWSTKYDLMGTDPNTSGYSLESSKDGLEHVISSKGKVVNNKFMPAKKVGINSKTGEIYFESNCEVEYDHPRQSDEGWVHLLLSQDFDNDLVYIKNLSSLVMEANFTVNFCENKTGSAYNINKHAAQLVWYITVQNRNRNSKGYGQYIWFGIPLWDNRTEGKATSMYRAYDEGTSTLIYNPSSADIYKDNGGIQPIIGNRAQAKIDVLNKIDEAFSYAKNNGYFPDTNFDDLAIGGTNFGYEIPGTFNIGATIHSINVFYKNATINSFTTTELNSKYEKMGYKNIFNDSNFLNGFSMTKCSYGSNESPYYDRVLDFYNKGKTPDWRICQWGSKNDFYAVNYPLISTTNGGYTHTINSPGKNNIPAKVLKFNTKNGNIYLEENGSVEYTSDRTDGEDWPALLLEQDFSNRLQKIDTLSSVIMECDYDILKCENKCDPNKYVFNMHAAQLVWYVTIQNRNQSSKGYGEYIWFGLNLYDNRYENKVTTMYSNLDAGTNTMIYQPSSSEFLKTNSGKQPTIGKRITASVDVLKLFPAAFNNAKKNGYFPNTNYSDLYLAGMNFGFEIPGIFDISSNIYSIGVFYK